MSAAPGYLFLASRTSCLVTRSWTWQKPSQAIICFFVLFWAHIDRFLSGMHITFSSGSDSMTFTTLAEVQQISLSAFTSAVVLTYATTGVPGYCFFISLSVKSCGKTNEGCTA